MDFDLDLRFLKNWWGYFLDLLGANIHFASGKTMKEKKNKVYL